MPVDSSYQIPCTGSLLQQWQQHFLNENHEPDKVLGADIFLFVFISTYSVKDSCNYVLELRMSWFWQEQLFCDHASTFASLQCTAICPQFYEWQDTAEQVVGMFYSTL